MAEYYVGEVRLVAFDYGPQDFLPCDGRALAINEYELLYSLIGTTYGGDGQSTFNLPNLSGRSPVHAGKAPDGVATYALGQSAGVETVTLTTGQIPLHAHTASVSNKPATSLKPEPALAPGDVGAGKTLYCNANQAGAVAALNDATLAMSNGGNQPHENVQPSLGLTYVIAVAGLFPA